MPASRRNRTPLVDRVSTAAEEALAAHDYVSPVDMLLRIRWLDFSSFERWQQGRVACLEDVIQVDPSRLGEALRLLEAWARDRGMVAGETDYVARTPQRPMLRFSRSGDASAEQRYRTHWVSGTLAEKKRARLAEKASRAPELVVVQPLKDDWRCHRCGGAGDLLIMEDPGPACLACVGLGDLEVLPAGDALLTRRARQKSARHAVIVRFSRTRRRYERQGLLLEPQAIADAQREIAAERN